MVALKEETRKTVAQAQEGLTLTRSQEGNQEIKIRVEDGRVEALESELESLREENEVDTYTSTPTLTLTLTLTLFLILKPRSTRLVSLRFEPHKRFPKIEI